MNKKGFTLIEVLVSISLIAVVLVSMMSTLVKLKEVNGAITKDTEVLVQGASLVRTINEDIITRGGIVSITNPSCTTSGVNPSNTCTINFTLRDGAKRRIALMNYSTVQEETAKYVTVKSTIEYTNPDIASGVVGNLLAIKTITDNLVKTYDNTLLEESNYYFDQITLIQKDYNNTVTRKKNTFYRITITVKDNPQYNLYVYSSKTSSI